MQGLHNLCVVYVERGRLAKAHECMIHVRQLAPHEDYILRHLQIVQTRIAKLRRIAGHTIEKEIAFEAFDPEDFGGSIHSSTAIDAIDGRSDDGDDPLLGKSAMPVAVPIVHGDDDAGDGGPGTSSTQKSVSKQPKPAATTSALNGAATTSATPDFLEPDAATIQEEYRPSNSVQNQAAERRQRFHQAAPLHRNVATPTSLIGAVASATHVDAAAVASAGMS